MRFLLAGWLKNSNMKYNIETDLQKCYNVYMSIGISSAYSAYSAQVNSVYSPPATSLEGKQENSDAQISTASANDEINDTADISDEAMNLYNKEQTEKAQTPLEKKASEKTADTKNSKEKSSKELTSQQQQEISKLKESDAEVKAHEQAHLSAAAGLRTSAPSYQYQTGPDGKKYAVAGEVNISFSQTGDPKKDLQMAETLKAAALAPANPSGQDMAVAKQADEMIQQDKQKIQEENQQTGTTPKEGAADSKEPKTQPEIVIGTKTDSTNVSDASKNSSDIQKTDNPQNVSDNQPVDVLKAQNNRPPIMVM